MKYSKLNDKQSAELKSVAMDIRKARKEVEKLIDKWFPVVISAVYAGNNISAVNHLIRALGPRTLEGKKLAETIRTMLPYQLLDTGYFGGKIKGPKEKVQKKTEELKVKFEEFVEVWGKYSTYLKEEERAKREAVAVEKTPEEVKADVIKRLTADLQKAQKIGMDFDEVMTVLNTVLSGPDADANADEVKAEAA